MMKVACLNKISPVGTKRLPKDYQIVEDLQSAELILVRSANMHEQPISKNLIAVARAGAGVNNIPLEAMAEAGVVVFNTPGANANGVKELVLAGMFLSARDIIGGVNWVKDNAADPEINKTVEKAKAAFGGSEILGKTIGVIGLGAVGGKVAKACADLGMKVLGYDPYLSAESKVELPQDIKIETLLDAIYAESDYLSLHLPLLESTKKMINQKVFEKVKPGVVLLNFSRDQLVDDDALLDAINSGIVRKYVTDFPNHKTANMPGVIAIPHLGASTEESEDNCAMMAVDELVKFVEEGQIKNSVNFPPLIGGKLNGNHRILILRHADDGFLAKLTAALAGKAEVKSIVDKTNQLYASTLVDLKDVFTDLKLINQFDSVIKTRIVK
ncbi:MAG: 3-phosphoglycerate dehydrogenase [Candidatus Izemoplasmatales bacterium]|nr:3-phosphoglycerate dehydrogenase [Candidatus Izemoplasmatales bacterium]